MVSESEVITTNTVCSCGMSDSENAQQSYFLNKCPVCDYKGKLGVMTKDHIQLSPDEYKMDSDNRDDSDSDSDVHQAVIIRCEYCGAEFCGQDGYDLYGGTRGSLTKVNPDEVKSDNDEVSEEQEEDKTYMSGWEGLCDLLKPLDGQAMMVQRGDYVIIKKIDMPQPAKLWAYEGFNVVDDSVTITDYTPEIYNTFLVKWGESYENEMEFVFEKHKALFGERKYVVEAKRVRNVKKDGEEEDENSEESSSDNGGSITDWIFGSDGENKSKSKSSKSSENKKSKTSIGEAVGDAVLGIGGGAIKDAVTGGSNDSLGTGSDEDDVESEEIPITTREEAIQFGLTQIGKAKREDGHVVELMVIGNQNWQMGEWCHVRLPSFNEDTYMFISKCNFESSADDEYIHSLTLVDYPPSLGKPLNAKSDSEEETEDSEEDTDENSDENTENQDSSSSDSGSNGGGAF